jgi:ribosomal-protein-serine acetyltransferase
MFCCKIDSDTELRLLEDRHAGPAYSLEDCRALLDHAFYELKLNRVEIRCAAENNCSRAVPERLGFRQDGVLRQAEWLHEHFVDLVIYSMLAGEWPHLRQP